MAVDYEALCDIIYLRQPGDADPSREANLLQDILRVAYDGTTVGEIVRLIRDVYVATDFTDEEASE